MKQYKNYAVLFKAIRDGENIYYLPVDILSGTYDENSHIFYDKNNTPYKHLIENPGSYGYACRELVEDKIKRYKSLPMPAIKAIFLNSFKKYTYLLTTVEDTNTPAILVTNKKNGEKELLLEDDALMFYKNSHPAFIELLKKSGSEEESEEDEKINVDINKLYNDITANIIGQDEQIKTILSTIWKQYNDFSNDRARNILIDGSTAVGKTEIIKNIIRLSNIPIVYTSITDYTPNCTQGRDITELLFSLIDRAGGNISKAESGIIVFDNLDKICDKTPTKNTVEKLMQNELIKFLEGDKLDMIYNYNEFSFDPSRLMIIGIGNFSREYKDKVMGFENASNINNAINRDDYVSKGLLLEFVSQFPIIIKMNDLGYDDFIKILKNSKSGALNLNKEFLKSQGIDLSVDDRVLSKIAKMASESKFGARILDEEVEKALAIASFEIAKNPSIYARLIINEETINDNKKYRLIRKFGK